MRDDAEMRGRLIKQFQLEDALLLTERAYNRLSHRGRWTKHVGSILVS
jgi:hypothetical protein